VPTFLGGHAVARELSPMNIWTLWSRKCCRAVTAENWLNFATFFLRARLFQILISRANLIAAKSSDSVARHVDQLTNSGGAKLMAEVGATTADHLEQTDEQGIAALKKANVQPVLLPGSVYALGSSGIPRA